MATPEAAPAKPRNLHRSYVATPKDAAANRAWWVIDATDKPLGRLASHVAAVLRGKHKPTFTPHEDAGDFVIVVNAGKVKLTGNKLEQKQYSEAEAEVLRAAAALRREADLVTAAAADLESATRSPVQ